MFLPIIAVYTAQAATLSVGESEGAYSTIGEAISALSQNQGSYRKAIWSYLMETYDGKVDYRDLLVNIQRLLKEGKLINEAGVYTIEETVYQELCLNKLTFKKKTPARSAS